MKRLSLLPIAVGLLALGTSSLPFVLESPVKVSADATTGAGLRFLGRFVSGSGIGGAEISAFDPATARLFVTNGKTNQIDVVDISRPERVKKIKSIDLASKGATGIQSVAVRDGLVAIATSVGGNNQANGKIFFTDTNGKLIKGVEDGVEVGALPDHVGFSPNGRYVLSANEGEPSSYCKTGGTLPKTTDPYGTISIIDVGGAVPSAATTIDFSAFDDRAGALGFQGGRIFGPGASLAQDVEPEYISFSADDKFAYVTLQENNAIATIDLATKQAIAIDGLGFKNHSVAGKGLDAVADTTANVATQNVYGMYQPDGIATLTATDGTTYLVTANEGDARSYPCLLGGTSTTSAESEDQKLSSVYDSTDSAITAAKNAVPSLVVTQFAPANARALAISSATKVKTAYAFGARSFSVWKPTNLSGVDSMTQVWDSGDQLEVLTAGRRPTYFNADWNTTTGAINAVDARSTKKGPEPEGVFVGKAYGKQWIVVGMERDGGLALYDASNPASPAFVDYINTSEPAGNLLNGANPGDVSPEGVFIVNENDSPTGSALVIASFELSGSVGIYEIPRKTPSEPRKVKATASNGIVTLKFKAPTVPGWAGDIRYQARCTVAGDQGTLVADGRTTSIRVAVPAALRNTKLSCTVSSSSSLGTGASAEPVRVTTK